jgi:hypothetical protein
MLQPYRKTIGSNIWHFCANCTTWPGGNYVASQNPNLIEDEELCSECSARHRIGDCEGHGDTELIGKRKCPVIVNGKECALDLIHIETEGKISELYQCSSGHRTRVVSFSK